MAQKKSGKARQKARKAKAAAPQQAAPRNRLARLGIYALGALVLAGGIWWGTSRVQADLYEQDLDRLGQGTPAIVQVHDPNCAPCADLQRETRAALKTVDDDDLTYLVASLTTTQGQIFASHYGASYATLLFFDGAGVASGNGIDENEVCMGEQGLIVVDQLARQGFEVALVVELHPLRSEDAQVQPHR